MLKFHLEKVGFGYKIICLGAKKFYSYDKKLCFRPKKLIGYIIVRKSARAVFSNNLIMAIDQNQFLYWLGCGAKYSKLFKKFLWLFNDFIIYI